MAKKKKNLNKDKTSITSNNPSSNRGPTKSDKKNSIPTLSKQKEPPRKSSFDFSFLKKILLWFVIIFIAILMLVSFAIPTGRLGRKSQVLGKVNGVSILNERNSMFARVYRRIYEYYQSQRLEIDQTIESTIMQLAFQETVKQVMQLQEADEAYIDISPTDIVNRVKSDYFTQEGKFDQQAYAYFKQQGNNLNKRLLEEEATSALKRGYLQHIVFSGSAIANRALSDRLNFSKIQRRAFFLIKNFEIKNNVTEAMLKDYYQNNVSSRYAGKTYEQVKDTTLSEDFYVDNQSLLLAKLKRDFEVEWQKKVIDGKSKNLIDIGLSLGCEVVASDYFNIFDSTIRDVNDAEIIDLGMEVGDVVSWLFSQPMQKAVKVLDEDKIIFAYVRDEKHKAKQFSFAKEAIVEEAKNQQIRRLRSAFDTYLQNKAKVTSYLDKQ